jgi:hypothetical protein
VLSSHFPSFRIRQPQLPDSWQDDIITCAHYFNTWRDLDGSSVTSREQDFGMSDTITVGTVAGGRVAENLPWLFDLYRTTFLEAVNNLGLGRYTTATDVRSAININSISPGGRYEWHVDSNPLTALLFVTEHAPGLGGELVFRADPRVAPDESWEHVVHPVPGELLMFDARRAAHWVTRVGGDKLRITVPMNYYLADDGMVSRPADLDGYLYGE